MLQRWERELDDVADAIQEANGSCVFLIGAGCSRSAGIPLASQLMAEIEKRHPRDYARAEVKGNYNSIMSQLSQKQRGDLLNPFISNAKINWAHLALAQLFHTGKIDRILTLNFDPLIMRACAMVGHFPAIYDLATAHEFKGNRVAPRSVFYLNGQHTGFVMLNGKVELENHRARLKEIVANTGVSRTWVVIGYSGDADPLLDILAENTTFDSRLYWIGFDECPSDSVRQKLLEPEDKGAFYIGGQDADRFLTVLAQKLYCFPPALLEKPFDHLINIVSEISFGTGGDEGLLLQQQFEQKILVAKTQDMISPKEPDLTQILLEGRIQDVIDSYYSMQQEGREPDGKQKESIILALLQSGSDLLKQAFNLDKNDPALTLSSWKKAADAFQQVLALNPVQVDALQNLAGAWLGQRRAETDPALRQALLEKAKALLLEVEREHPGKAMYNLACVAALEGDAPTCLKYLNDAHQVGMLPHYRYILADQDFASIRDDESVQAWFERLSKGQL